MKPIKVNGVVVCCSNCINHQVSPKERFLTLEKMVKKYKDQFAAMKADAKAHGISIEELCKQFANRRTIEVWIDGIQ